MSETVILAERIRGVREDVAPWKQAHQMFGRFSRDGSGILGYLSGGYYLVSRPMHEWPEEVHGLFNDALGLEGIPGWLYPVDPAEWSGRVDAADAVSWCGQAWSFIQDCDRCAGTGECKCSCGDDHDCGLCDGTGEVDDDPPCEAVLVGPRVVQRHFLGRCLQLMEASGEVALSWRGDMLLVACGDRRGIIMRYNQETADAALPVESLEGAKP